MLELNAINVLGTATVKIFVHHPTDITKFWVVGNYNDWDISDAAKYIISTRPVEAWPRDNVYLTARWH
jgi:hypothetical protein